MVELPAPSPPTDRPSRRLLLPGASDLTRTCLGFSRDDVESAFMRSASTEDRQAGPLRDNRPRRCQARPDGRRGYTKPSGHHLCSVCSETGGDPRSIQVYYDLGSTTRVSCSRRRACLSSSCGGWLGIGWRSCQGRCLALMHVRLHKGRGLNASTCSLSEHPGSMLELEGSRQEDQIAREENHSLRRQQRARSRGGTCPGRRRFPPGLAISATS